MANIKSKAVVEESEEDKELQEEFKLLVNRIRDQDTKQHIPALDMLRFLIRTSTTSMTSVPKPLKYLAQYYATIKQAREAMKDPLARKKCADIISVLAIGMVGGKEARTAKDCVHYCLMGTMKDVGDWGHEYVRQLEEEIVEEWAITSKPDGSPLNTLVASVIKFDMKYHAEIQACDLLMEIDRLHVLHKYVDSTTYKRVCSYLISCTGYVEEVEATKILRAVVALYVEFEEYALALIIAMQLKDQCLINKIFGDCKDVGIVRQMGFIVARQQQPVQLPDDIVEDNTMANILSNSQLSGFFQTLSRELDVLEPKSPDEVYKTWLEPTSYRQTILGENLDSARQNLASSYVNAFVNAGFGKDKLLTVEDGNKWIYRNKDHGMTSATAALGLLHLWDVDGGLTPIDKYLYTNEDHVKSGALLALGIVNCRVHNECDPALALLADYLGHANTVLRNGAVFGLGIAYAGSARADIIAQLLPAVESAVGPESLAIASLSCGLVSVGTCNSDVTVAVLSRLFEFKNTDVLQNPHVRLVVLGIGLCYLGRRDSIEAPNATLDVFSNPFKGMAQTLLLMCAYAGTGDVLMIQELLGICTERQDVANETADQSKSEEKKTAEAPKTKSRRSSKREMDPNSIQAVAALAVAAISINDEISVDMCQRILGNMGRYGDVVLRRAVPLAMALTSVSNANMQVIELLTKYSHDSDEEVSCNAIFSMGLVGSGTNNARLATSLRQLASYHTRNANQLFMVRLAQGLVHLGKGTLTLSPFHNARQLMDPCGMAGLLIVLVAMLDVHSTILGRYSHLLYTLATAMHPRWLLTVNENLEPISVPVRVGQAVDIIGKAGTPKVITGIHTHSTPVLLGAGERAELATNAYIQMGPNLDGICILRRKLDTSSDCSAI